MKGNPTLLMNGKRRERLKRGKSVIPKVKIFARTNNAFFILLHATHDVQPPVLVKGNMFKL
jgi:hypothetical protein